MAIETTPQGRPEASLTEDVSVEPGIGRRALVAGGVASVVAAGLAALTGARPAVAGVQTITTGFNEIDDNVSLFRVDLNDDVFVQLALGNTAIFAFSRRPSANTIDAAAYGTNGVGVLGRTTGHYSQIAVDADVTSGLGEGIGVRGRTQNGIAVQAIATGGHALNVQGRAVFDRSGKVSFAQGQSARTVSGYPIAADTIVVATIQGNVAGTYVRGVSLSVTNDTFTIRLNKAAPKALKVGYFIVN